ncbi:MAG: hydrogenase [Bacteroidetes bacterium]|nr:hydrogenase [Bacteroidota bacterium]
MAKLFSRIIVVVTFLIVIVSSYFAVKALVGKEQEIMVAGNFILGDIPLRIDALSAWMILIINFTVLTGVLYGVKYLEHYKDKINNTVLHLSLIVVFHLSMLFVCIVQNFLAFLIVWEIMAISSFLLVIFEYWNKETIRAGINYLIQSHIGVLFLTVAYIWVITATGSEDFKAIQIFSQQVPPALSVTFFVLIFIGFGFKAGFIPFHTWLPYAHPSAPSHISGMMSGVIIKLGIYGILRVILLLKSDFVVIGVIILIVSMFSGLYGVMLAIVQHNLKKLLAYHSIENIGIIGIGIGLGTLGLGLKNDFLAITGFAGGLLHILNHSLFKSLLFYGAGSVYQQTHTLNIEKLGGLVKRMPKTSALFLIAAAAICGLPPFNGFISEFLIYSGLFSGLKTFNFSLSLFMLSAIVSLVLIGGLAILCFTKVFGTVFLGTERSKYAVEPHEVSGKMIFPQYLIAALIIGIGIFPQFFLMSLRQTISLFVPTINTTSYSIYFNQINILANIGLTGGLILLLVFILYSVKKWSEKKKIISVEPTWGCGYVAPNERMQYTASSFVKNYVNLIEPVLSIKKSDVVIQDVFPSPQKYESSTYDKIEYYVIDKNVKLIKKLLYRFDFLQNGKIQYYILYGLIFIILIILYAYGESFLKLLSEFYKMF